MTRSMPHAAPVGTEDILPERIATFRRVEAAVRAVCARFGYEEIRTPVFEHRELFERGVGDTTDIVEKEMFVFDDCALRPEMTASTVRAIVEHALYKRKGLQKLFYIGPAFRKERPQKGRLRQFHQFGVEAVGSADPLVDVETVLLLSEILAALGVGGTGLKVNSIGCPDCRGAYRDALREAIRGDLLQYCENCRRRFDRNPFRILDCKQERCRALSAKAPSVIDSNCAACRAHFDGFTAGLRGAGLEFAVEPRIVRGLDYYTRTVYEFTSTRLGAQDALCGGGRYDRLVADLGGPELPAVGFAAGIERIVMLIEETAPVAASDVFVVTITPAERPAAFALLTGLRRRGLSGDMDFEGRKVKGQMRAANVAGARFVMILGPDEAARGRVKLKSMADGTEVEVSPDEAAARIGGSR